MKSMLTLGVVLVILFLLVVSATCPYRKSHSAFKSLHLELRVRYAAGAPLIPFSVCLLRALSTTAHSA